MDRRALRRFFLRLVMVSLPLPAIGCYGDRPLPAEADGAVADLSAAIDLGPGRDLGLPLDLAVPLDQSIPLDLTVRPRDLRLLSWSCGDGGAAGILRCTPLSRTCNFPDSCGENAFETSCPITDCQSACRALDNPCNPVAGFALFYECSVTPAAGRLVHVDCCGRCG